MTKIDRVLFIGSKALGLTIAQEMFAASPDSFLGVLTIDDSGDTRTVFPGIKEFAREIKRPCYVAENAKDSERIIAELKPQLCIVAGWYWLLTPAVLSSVPNGFIGIHNSLLPMLRGGAPLVWSIILGHREAGVSFFSFTPGLDDGPVWAMGRVPIGDDDYVSDVLEKLEAKTVQLFRESYREILAGQLTPIEQDQSLATYCALRQPVDGSINWNLSAIEVLRFIRAQSNPYPGAFTYFEAAKLTIWRARRFLHEYVGTPGQIARRSDDGVYVVCGDNRAIILEEVEISGKKGKARDLITSIKARLSSSIGDSLTDYPPAR